MKASLSKLVALLVISSAVVSNSYAAVAFSNLQFLSGTAATGEVLNTAGTLDLSNQVTQFNTMDNDTGVKLAAAGVDGYPGEFSFSASNIAGALGAASVTLNPSGGSARVRDNHSFNGAVTANNPGTVNQNTLTLLFSSYLTITDASFSFSSLNTGGNSTSPTVTWEYSVLQLLDTAGNPFSAVAAPALDFAMGGSSQYLVGSSGGFSGVAGIGNFVAADKKITNVGTSLVAGNLGSGTNDNLTLTYALVGLPVGTQIGGMRWTTYLEDVRGVNNGNSNFTSSLLDFTISGTVVPEPGTAAVLLFGSVGLVLRRARNRR
jgi:hypothetical protein